MDWVSLSLIITGDIPGLVGSAFNFFRLASSFDHFSSNRSHDKCVPFPLEFFHFFPLSTGVVRSYPGYLIVDWLGWWHIWMLARIHSSAGRLVIGDSGG